MMINRISRIALSDNTYLNHASQDLNMLKPKTSRSPRRVMMISECTRILAYF